MKDPLDLSFSSITGTFISPSQNLSEHVKKLLAITDFKERLQYYNKHICSLAYGVYEGLHLFGQYDYFSGYREFILKKANPDENPDFEIYLRERQKEINRLKTVIGKQKGYADKLKCFIEAKAGQIRLDVFELKIENNAYEKFIANGGGTVPDHLLGNNAEIDLRPTSPEERKVYNLYLYNYVQELIKEPQKLHWLVEVEYKGFLSVPAFELFKKQMQKAFNSASALTTEIKRVEDKFYANQITNYIENLYPYEVKNTGFWQIALFNAFLNGHEFDYGRKLLTEHEMQVVIHVEQALEYYKQLHKLKEALSNQRKPAVETLTPEQVRAKHVSQFERELEFGKIPFVDLINKKPAFRGELLNEYLTAEMKPCFAFFRAEHYSEKEMNNGWADANSKIPISTGKGIVAASLVATTPFESHLQDLGQEFDEMIVKKTLPAKYYCPDIQKTVIVQALRKIHGEIDVLRKSVFDATTDKYKEAELRAKSINDASQPLGRFADLVLAEVKNDSFTLLLELSHPTATQRNFWAGLKSNFNNALSKPQMRLSIKGERSEIKAPIIALFCSIVNESGLVKREQTETVQAYCERVCKQYGLPYTDRVRQNFPNNHTKKNAEKLKQDVLPFISESERQKLMTVLENKKQPKQKLYG